MQNFEIENKLDLAKEEILQTFIEQNILVKHLEEEKNGRIKVIIPEFFENSLSNSHTSPCIPLLTGRGKAKVTNTIPPLLQERGLGGEVLFETPKI